jgi:hypothetical protein
VLALAVINLNARPYKIVSMECSVCYEGITASTGQATLSCTHSFHIRCLVKWFDSQIEKELKETCPCCRHEATQHEKLPEYEAPGVEEDYESDTEEESDDISNLVITWHVTGDTWTRTVTTETPEWVEGSPGLMPQSLAFQLAVSARKIQALWRGYSLRKTMTRGGGKRPRAD